MRTVCCMFVGLDLESNGLTLKHHRSELEGEAEDVSCHLNSCSIGNSSPHVGAQIRRTTFYSTSRSPTLIPVHLPIFSGSITVTLPKKERRRSSSFGPRLKKSSKRTIQHLARYTFKSAQRAFPVPVGSRGVPGEFRVRRNAPRRLPTRP